MKQFLQRAKQSLIIWMQGRYGMDEMSKAMNIAGLVLVIVCSFFRQKGMVFFIISWIGCAMIIYSSIRVYSRNIYKRQQERSWYLRWSGKIRSAVSLQKRRWTDRKTFLYIKCECGTVLRAPRNKGKIKLHCPKCGKEKIVRS